MRSAGPLLAPVLAAGALAVWDPTRRGGPPLCPFRMCTGVACPACGLTRAAGSLLRGRLHEAVTMHPLIPVVFAEVLAAWLVTAIGRRDWFTRHPYVGRVLLWANVVAFVGVWALRLGTGSIHVVE